MQRQVREPRPAGLDDAQELAHRLDRQADRLQRAQEQAVGLLGGDQLRRQHGDLLALPRCGPAMRNWVQLMVEIQPTRSLISESGLKLNFRIRLPGGSFLHWLNSCSPGSPPPSPVFCKRDGRRGAGAGRADVGVAGDHRRRQRPARRTGGRRDGPGRPGRDARPGRPGRPDGAHPSARCPRCGGAGWGCGDAGAIRLGGGRGRQHHRRRDVGVGRRRRRRARRRRGGRSRRGRRVGRRRSGGRRVGRRVPAGGCCPAGGAWAGACAGACSGWARAPDRAAARRGAAPAGSARTPRVPPPGRPTDRREESNEWFLHRIE